MVRRMGVDAYQTNQTSRTAFRAIQRATPAKVPPPQPAAAPSAGYAASAMKCRPLYYVPPIDWVLLPVKCRTPEQKSHQILSRVAAPGPPGLQLYTKHNTKHWAALLRQLPAGAFQIDQAITPYISDFDENLSVELS